MTRRFLVLACAATVGAATARAQEALLPSTAWGVGTALSAWHFSKSLPQSSGGVADVAEFAIPFRLGSRFGRWNFDVSGAGAIGAVHLAAGASGGEDRLISIMGPTDLKLRVTGAIVGDALQLTAGLNVPTGKVGLNGDETSTLQVVGAPALQMPVAAYGTGAGATLGLVRAFQGDDWAFALGASAEQRTEYSPIALALSGGRAETKVTPGTALHVTAGLDRPLGEGRWSLLFVGDVFSKDKIRLSGGGADQANDFTLGPQYTLISQLEFGGAGWRTASFNVAARMRSDFSDAAGVKVANSSGTYLEGSLGGVLGGPAGAGLIIGADARMHSGLKFTDALVGAAVTAAGVTLGLERAGTSTLTRFTLHGQYGTFDTGTAQATGMGVTLGMSVAARREAR